MQCIFLDQDTFSSKIDLSTIQQQVEKLTIYQQTTEDQIVKRCQHADIIITNKVVLSAETLKQLPKLQLICVAATGTNNIDKKAAKECDITICNVQNYANQSVAQYVFAQLLEHFSAISSHNNNTKKGLWQKNSTFCLHGLGSTELAGKTLGIIGYGSLGKSVATIAEAFGMKVIIAERKFAKNIRAGRTNFESFLQQSDVISLHCPLTEATHHLIDEYALAKTRNNLVLINTARGDVIKDSALLSALKNNDIDTAILDVLSQEPPPADHVLLSSNLDNLKITGHVAWASIEAQQRLINIIAHNIKMFKQKDPINLV